MSTNIAKSFGLALMLAVGVIATVMFLGWFNTGGASAAALTASAIESALNEPITPGSGASYTIIFRNQEQLNANSGQLWVVFDSLISVPSTIEKERITITTSGGKVSNPAFDPEVVDDGSGNTIVKVTIGDTNPSDTSVANPLIAWDSASTNLNGNPLGVAGRGGHIVKFSTLAGLKNSTAASSTAAWVKITSNGAPGLTGATAIPVYRHLKLSAGGGARGTVVTVTGKGFSNGGTANIFIDSDSSVTDSVPNSFDATDTQIGTSDATISGGEFTASFTVDTKFDVGANSINAIDGGGITADNSPQGARYVAQRFTLTGSISIKASAVRGESVTVSVVDFGGSGLTGNVLVISIGGVQATLPSTVSWSNNTGSFAVTVPATTPLGTQTVRLLSTTEGTATAGRSTTIVIAGLSMVSSPTTAVANQAITISASGFANSSTLASVTVAGETVTTLTDGTTVITKSTDSSGNLVATFVVPSDETTRTPGTHKVRITDGDNRIGEVDLIIPSRALTIDPAESRRGSTITFSGTGFQASATIAVTYAGASTPRTTVSADNSGNISGSFTVPTSSGIPSSNSVVAAIACTTGSGTDLCTQLAAAQTHKVPAATITVTPTSAAIGEIITVTGNGFPGFVSVSSLDIATVSAVPSPAPSTNVDGEFTATALVPQIGTGSQALLVTAGSVTATTSFTVVAATAAPVVTTNNTEDVFADEIASDNLVRVWLFSNADQSWSFFDPRPAFAAANTLTESTSGDIVWVNVTAETTFQSQTLYPGWNLISLD